VGKVKVSKAGTVRGTSAVLKVQAPAAGTIAASGAGLVLTSKRASKAGATSVTVGLSQAAQKTLARKRKLVVKVAVRFRPAAGAASIASVTVTFVAKATARRATVLSSESRKGR
jgi:acyl-CoA hydrolase